MRALLAMAFCACAAIAGATEPPVPPPPRDASRIDGDAAAAAQGVLSVNVAAGTGNAQANVRSIAIGDPASLGARQTVDAGAADLRRDAVASIGGGAFGSARGVVGINQAVGSGNAQLNVLAIGRGASVVLAQQVDNLALAATRAQVALEPDAPPPPAPLREARIEGAALRAPGGVVQINQTAGAGNASANAIVLHLPGGTP